MACCVPGLSLPSPGLVYTGLKKEKNVHGELRLLWSLKRRNPALRRSEGFRGRGKVQVVETECRGNREARRTGPARRVHPGLASIHRVTGAILGSAIPAPSPPSSTSKNSGKNHMSSWVWFLFDFLTTIKILLLV
uniref:Uncharacterized protein n=1 Tax=Mus spicilegus TaxID=10103 RepID=A0A8C6HZQ8_MUSSI